MVNAQFSQFSLCHSAHRQTYTYSLSIYIYIYAATFHRKGWVYDGTFLFYLNIFDKFWTQHFLLTCKYTQRKEKKHQMESGEQKSMVLSN